FESTILDPQCHEMMLEFFSSSIILYVIYPYLIPEKPLHPVPDILKPEEKRLEENPTHYPFFAKIAPKKHVEHDLPLRANNGFLNNYSGTF
ncbi:MAG: hypothetical protein JO131_02750, partial [Gammaproteobacteria bacterium]|nr:hypothetical protein [Gammaproteobacteria bacterium]